MNNELRKLCWAIVYQWNLPVNFLFYLKSVGGFTISKISGSCLFLLRFSKLLHFFEILLVAKSFTIAYILPEWEPLWLITTWAHNKIPGLPVCPYLQSMAATGQFPKVFITVSDFQTSKFFKGRTLFLLFLLPTTELHLNFFTI